MKIAARALAMAGVWLAAVSSAAALEVTLQVTEIDQVARDPAVVTTGVPFARGQVTDVGKLTVSVAGAPVPAQFIAIAPWDDGSVRWALMDVQVAVPAGGKVELLLTDAASNPAPASPAGVQDGPDAVRVSTGPLQFAVGKKKFNLFQSLTVDGRELLTAAGRGLVLHAEDGRQIVAGAPSEVVVEQAGPMRTVVRVRGRFPGVHDGLLGYTVRISAFSGQRCVRVHAWLENHGAMGYHYDRNKPAKAEWFPFKGLAVELGLGLGETVTARCEDVEATDKLKVLQLCRRQLGDDPDRRGGPYFTWDDFEYTIASDERELKRGARTDGVVALAGQAGSLVAAVRDFWENYEKAIELDGGKLNLWLWPVGGQWPRPHPNVRSRSYFDSTLQNMPRDGLYLLPGAVHKGHEFLLDFSGRDPRQSAAELSAPLTAFAPPEHYASTEAAPGLFAPPQVRAVNGETSFKLASWVRMAQSVADAASETGLHRARRISAESNHNYHRDSTYWFGWMDFGDLAVPGFGPAHLNYDWTWIMLTNAMRLGDAHAMRLGTAMARHHVDVDQFWSDRDPAPVNRLQRGNNYDFPSMHCYRLYGPPDVSRNWLAGVVLYHMLTGEPKALEAARRNAEGVRVAWSDGQGPRRNVEAVAWSVDSFLAMHKLTGEQAWLDEALALFKQTIVPGAKERGPFLGGGRQYCFAVASFCALHHRTGEQAVLDVLAEGCANEFPADTFFEAPLYLADLFAYVGYKTDNADLLKRAEQLFAAGFPESRCPPVFLPNNSTWARTSATMLRTGHVLQYVNWKLNRGR